MIEQLKRFFTQSVWEYGYAPEDEADWPESTPQVFFRYSYFDFVDTYSLKFRVFALWLNITY